MATSFVISLREVLEAALIISIVLSVLRKMGRQDLSTPVWLGTISATLVSVFAAIGLNWTGTRFEGKGEEVFEGLMMFLAAGVLTWMVFWMSTQSRMMKQKIEVGVRDATKSSGRRALFLLAFLAVVREGIELALFLLAARFASSPIQELFGATLGIGTAILLSWIIFTNSRKLSLSKFFQYTNVLLVLFAGGLVGLGIHEFNESGWIPAIIEHVWDLSPFLDDESALGQLLKAFVGYSSSPSLSQVIGYVGYYVVLSFVLWRRNRPAESHQTMPAAN